MPEEQPSDDYGMEDMVGVIKIKDGLFICDELGAQVSNWTKLSCVFLSTNHCVYQDLEFIVANKVMRVVNTAGTQLRNFWETIGVLYLTLNWQDDEKQTLFDAAEKIPEEIFRFMEQGINNHESVLI